MPQERLSAESTAVCNRPSCCGVSPCSIKARMAQAMAVDSASKRESGIAGLPLGGVGADQLRRKMAAGQGREYPVGDPGGQVIGPLADRLRRDPHRLGGGGRAAAQELNGVRFAHARIEACFHAGCKHACRGSSARPYAAGKLAFMEYGERLNEALKSRGKSRQWLADRLGISVQAVGMVIRGESKAFDAVNHSRACQVLEVSPLWLAAGEGDMEARRLSFSDLSPYEAAFIALVREGLTEEEFLNLHQATAGAVKTKKAKLQQGLQVGEIGVYFTQDRRHHEAVAVREQRVAWSEVEREARLRASSSK